MSIYSATSATAGVFFVGAMELTRSFRGVLPAQLLAMSTLGKDTGLALIRPVTVLHAASTIIACIAVGTIGWFIPKLFEIKRADNHWSYTSVFLKTAPIAASLGIIVGLKLPPNTYIVSSIVQIVIERLATQQFISPC